MRDLIELTSMGDLLVRGSERFGERNLLVFPEVRITYAEMFESALVRAKALVAKGISHGDHIGILMANCLEFIECLMAAQLVGAVVVPINARFKSPELAYVLENADIDLIFTHDRISEYANFEALLNEAIRHGRPPRLQTMVMIGADAPGFVSDSDFLAGGRAIDVSAVDALRQSVRVRDPAIMMYTSGTTANPKGCPLNHEVLVRGGVNWNRYRLFLTEGESCWAPLPMFHTASILPLMCCMSVGATLLSMTHFEPGKALQQLEGEHATVAFPAFPAVTMALINHPRFSEMDLSSIRLISTVAPPEVLRQFQDAFPQAVQVGAYGMTEAGGIIASNHVDEPLEVRLRTSGKPLPGLSAKIVDPDTLEEQPPGKKGEILLKGYAVFDGYYRSPEKNAESFVDDWFRTGDLCSIDDVGHIEFHGRIKDMLKVGGENVAAIEIESLLSTHPAIAMAQIIGVPDDRLTEVACAYIELENGASLSLEALIDFCKDKIASYKVPRHVRFVTNWPMSTTKVQKYVLREWYDSESD